MKTASLAVSVKLWALFCMIAAVSLTENVLMTCGLSVLGFAYLGAQKNFRFLRSYGAFYLLLAVLLYFIRYHGMHMVIFSEFYVLMFWNLSPIVIVSWDLVMTPPGELSAFLSRIHTPTPIILGLLVVFRFFPTMKAELCGVGRSMRNRGLTAPSSLFRHPAASCEYILVPMLLRCLQIADQLSVSAVARGAECPGRRGSYYGRSVRTADWIWILLWTTGTVLFLALGGVRI